MDTATVILNTAHFWSATSSGQPCSTHTNLWTNGMILMWPQNRKNRTPLIRTLAIGIGLAFRVNLSRFLQN